MAILKVARMGHPILRQVARQIKPDEFGSDDLVSLVEDMMETMEEYGGIGLAAPQVHESLQLAIIGFDNENQRYPGLAEQEMLVLCNPVITVLDPEVQTFWEGCLSVPGLRGQVSRPRKIRVDFQDLEGKRQSIEPEGFLATVFQHELDHLAGVIYVDRVEQGPGKTQLAFQEEFDRYLTPAEDDEVGILED